MFNCVVLFRQPPNVLDTQSVLTGDQKVCRRIREFKRSIHARGEIAPAAESAASTPGN